ncbi:MAG TPA: hypothetical protein VGQ07_03675 [Nitrospirales bacterium]|jgi:hypothetical protein|nr:hypothetical protein [Nitrospirales bacterium]
MFAHTDCGCRRTPRLTRYGGSSQKLDPGKFEQLVYSRDCQVTFFEFFIHLFAFIIRERLAIVLLVVTTILIPAVSEGRFLSRRKVMFKPHDSRMMLLVKLADQLYRFLPIISDVWVSGRVDFKKSLNLHESVAQFFTGIIELLAFVSTQSKAVANENPKQQGQKASPGQVAECEHSGGRHLKRSVAF